MGKAGLRRKNNKFRARPQDIKTEAQRHDKQVEGVIMR